MPPPNRTPIPGTYVFDGKQSALGYELNKLVSSLAKAENRAAFIADEDGYAARFNLTEEQREALKSRNFLRMLQLGANIYYLYKMTALPELRMKMTELGALQAGLRHDDYLKTLYARGNREWPA